MRIETCIRCDDDPPELGRALCEKCIKALDLFEQPKTEPTGRKQFRVGAQIKIRPLKEGA